MIVEGEFTFLGPREEVWDLLQDPEVLARALPGTKKLEKTGDDAYQGEMGIRIGPVNGIFSVTVVLKDKVPSQSYTMRVEGSASPGFVKGMVQVQLRDRENNTTLMTYRAELNVGGRLASLGQRLLDTVGKSLTRKSLEAMNQALQERLGKQTKET